MSEGATIPAPATGTPGFAVPLGACDAHTHIFGPSDRFKPSQKTVYPLPEAGPAQHRHMRDRLGMSRALLVQPAPYAQDPAAMLAAIADSDGALKGVASASDVKAPLENWAERGIVGLRFTEARTPGGDRYPGSVGFDELVALGPAMRSSGLQAHLWAPLEVLCEHLPALSRLGLPLVIDHLGMVRPGAEKAFDILLDFVRDADIWIKLTLCRLARPDLEPADWLEEMHQRTIETRPERMLWGSDWPYVRLDPAPDAAQMLNLFAAWTPEPALRQRILVDNPNRAFFSKGKH